MKSPTRWIELFKKMIITSNRSNTSSLINDNNENIKDESMHENSINNFPINQNSTENNEDDENDESSHKIDKDEDDSGMLKSNLPLDEKSEHYFFIPR